MNKVIDTILKRVSCRTYGPRKVSSKKLDLILEAGKAAPSGMNRQTCTILAIKRRSYLESIRAGLEKKFGRDCLYGAPSLCLVYGKKDEPLLVQDGSCILENMFLAATALGIDSCWINQLNELIEDPAYAKLRAKLGLSEEDRIVGSAIFGYREEGKEIPVKAHREDAIRII